MTEEAERPSKFDQGPGPSRFDQGPPERSSRFDQGPPDRPSMFDQGPQEKASERTSERSSRFDQGPLETSRFDEAGDRSARADDPLRRPQQEYDPAATMAASGRPAAASWDDPARRPMGPAVWGGAPQRPPGWCEVPQRPPAVPAAWAGKGQQWGVPMAGAAGPPARPPMSQGFPGRGMPRPGHVSVMQGFVKSYNSVKGFGFILHPEVGHDIYFARESLEPGLRTSDLAGTDVMFELHHMRDGCGKPQAQNLRPIGPVDHMTKGGNHGKGSVSTPFLGKGMGGPMGAPVGVPMAGVPGMPPMGMGMGMGVGMPFPPRPGMPFVRPGVIVPGAAPGFLPAGAVPVSGPDAAKAAAPPVVPKRPLSPHAGSRAIAEARIAERKAKEAADKRSNSSSSSRGRSRSRSKSDKKSEKSRSPSSSSSSSSSSASRSRRRKKKEKRNGGGGSTATEQSSTGNQEPKEVQEAKRDALQKLKDLQKVEPLETRMKEWRKLLRAWHPDKNPDKVEVSTAVFQFLQKGKVLLDSGR